MDLKSVIKTFAEAWAAASLKMEQAGPPAALARPPCPTSYWAPRPLLPPWPPSSPLLLPPSLHSTLLPHLGLESLARLGREGWSTASLGQVGGNWADEHLGC